jgi:amidophosphoribosyltransferase
MAAYDPEEGLQREIHNIQNSPFRTKFEKVFDEMRGNSAIGCISDYDPQPLLIRSMLGTYAICTIGIINNTQSIIDEHLSSAHGHFQAMTGNWINSTEILASLINRRESFAEGIKFAQEIIDGTTNILILKDDGSLIVARDKVGRLPVIIGKGEDGYCVTMESFASFKLDYEPEYELGPGEIIEITADGYTQLAAPGKEKRVCSFMWTYYGYSTSTYEGVNVELMRYRNGEILAREDKLAGNAEGVQYVSGVPDSGTPHAIGYANKSGIPFARPFIKYTPTWARSFTPTHQREREKVAKMKQIPVHELIEDKNLLFVDDSIVRGTQLKGTVDFLYSNGAKAVHMRSACPPIMYSCKYLNFSSSNSEMELITRRIIMELEGEEGFNYIKEYSNTKTERGKKLRAAICEKLGFKSLEFQSLDGIVEAIGLKKSELCTYCWDGEE